MAVGVIDGTSEAIFKTLMTLGPSRSEWDFCFYRGSVVEHLDGHTDIIHMQLYNHWMPWGLKRRDLLLRRYWRREEDGTYVILYHSVVHSKCPPQEGYVRATVKSGGHVVVPSNQGKSSIVKHMLSVDWKFWKSYLRKETSRSITICMLGRIAALREMFKAQPGSYFYDASSGELTIDIQLPLGDKEQRKKEVSPERVEEEIEKHPSGRSSLVGLNDVGDEFFDVAEPSDDEQSDHGWSSSSSPDYHSVIASLLYSNKLRLIS
ncbi:unnamed protein product [Cuscuta europaea]|nr:unnamed protein product [Cuscuta europaea]